MLDFDLIKNLLMIALASGIIITSLVQKIKEMINFKKSNWIILASFIVSLILGTLFALSFSDISFINSLWVGLFSFIGADTIYKMFEDKLFESYSNINDNTLEIPKENEIK